MGKVILSLGFVRMPDTTDGIRPTGERQRPRQHASTKKQATARAGRFDARRVERENAHPPPRLERWNHPVARWADQASAKKEGQSPAVGVQAVVRVCFRT